MRKDNDAEAQRGDELPPLIRPSEAFELIDVGKTKGNELIARNEIPGIVRFGPRCVRIKRAVLLRWLNGTDQ